MGPDDTGHTRLEFFPFGTYERVNCEFSLFETRVPYTIATRPFIRYLFDTYFFKFSLFCAGIEEFPSDDIRRHLFSTVLRHWFSMRAIDKGDVMGCTWDRTKGSRWRFTNHQDPTLNVYTMSPNGYIPCPGTYINLRHYIDNGLVDQLIPFNAPV